MILISFKFFTDLFVEISWKIFDKTSFLMVEWKQIVRGDFFRKQPGIQQQPDVDFDSE